MNQFENDPRLKNLMPLKRQIILELANGSHNATMEQMLPQIMQLNRELQNVICLSQKRNPILSWIL